MRGVGLGRGIVRMRIWGCSDGLCMDWALALEYGHCCIYIPLYYLLIVFSTVFKDS
jgi:hypothetical protein